MRNGFKVIDADAHMQDEMANWLDFVEAEFWDRKPRVRIAADRFGGMGAPQQIEVLPCELFPLGVGISKGPAEADVAVDRI